MPTTLKVGFVALMLVGCQRQCSSSHEAVAAPEVATAHVSEETSCPPLAHALSAGDLAETQRLLEKEAALDWEILFKPGATATVGDLCRKRGATAPTGKFLSPLHLAVRTGEVELARSLLARKVPLEERDPYGFTALWIAVSQKNAPMVELLLAGGADVRSKLALSGRDLYEDLRPEPRDLDAQKKLLQGATYLHLAAQQGDLPLVRRFLELGIPVDAPTDQSRTPLHFTGDAAVATLLLEKGASVDAKDADGLTPLALAVVTGNLPEAQALAAHGANTGGRPLLSDAGKALAKGHAAGPPLVVESSSLLTLPALHQAAHRGDEVAVRKLLGAGAVDARDDNGRTALHYAAAMGHPAVVKALLEKKAAPNATDSTEQTPLHLAAGGIWLDHLEVIKLLVAAHGDLKAFDRVGNSPLHVAAMLGHVEMIRALVALGAEVDLSNRFRLDVTPLHLAARAGQTDAVNALLDLGAKSDVVSENGHGLTPLMEAATHDRRATAEVLLRRGAKIDATDGQGCTALHEAALLSEVDTLQLLLSQGAAIEAHCKDGVTPLMRAAQGGRREVVAALLDKGASVNAREEDGTTALDMAEMFAGHAVVALLNDHGAKHGKDLGALPPKTQARPTADATVCPEPVFAAAKKGQAAAVNKDLGCDPGAKDASGTTPLHWAVVADQPQMIGALVNRSARIDAVDGQNLTPLALAVLLDRRQVAEQILAHGAGVDAAWKVPDTLYSNTPLTLVAYGLKDQFEYLGFSREMTPLHLAAKLGRIELARMLLDRHANLKAQSLPLGLTPLHVAADGGPLELIKLLLDRGADVNAQDGLKQTPLFNAAGSGDVDAVKLLLARGANVHARGEGFGTALNLVLELHNENAAEVVGVLLQHRADPNSRGQSEATPLHQVAFGQDAKIAKLLLERGADPKLKDADGRTPLDLAKLAKNQPLEDLLSKAAGP